MRRRRATQKLQNGRGGSDGETGDGANQEAPEHLGYPEGGLLRAREGTQPAQCYAQCQRLEVAERRRRRWLVMKPLPN